MSFVASAADLIYQLYSDNAARAATKVIETGTVSDSTYGPDALTDDNPAKVAKIDATTGAWMIGNGVAKIPAELIGLIHHDFAAGCDVKIQGNDTNAWGTPSFSAAITIPTWDGYSGPTINTLWPVNAWLDLTTASGYSAAGWKYWRLVVTSNNQNLQLGQLWLGTAKRTFDRDIAPGFAETVDSPATDNRTAAKVSTIYWRGTFIWSGKMVQHMTAAVKAASFAQFFNVGGVALPWLIIPHANVNRCYLVRLRGSWNTSAVLRNLDDHGLDIEELGRGLRPGTL